MTLADILAAAAEARKIEDARIEAFLATNPDPHYCSRMDAICPAAGTCYSETIETTDTECSEGRVLCTDVDNEDNRYMYEKSELDFLVNNEDNSVLPF